MQGVREFLLFVINLICLFMRISIYQQNAPMFKNMTGRKGGAAGSGKSAILRAQGKIFLSESTNIYGKMKLCFVVPIVV